MGAYGGSKVYVVLGDPGTTEDNSAAVAAAIATAVVGVAVMLALEVRDNVSFFSILATYLEKQKLATGVQRADHLVNRKPEFGRRITRTDAEPFATDITKLLLW